MAYYLHHFCFFHGIYSLYKFYVYTVYIITSTDQESLQIFKNDLINFGVVLNRKQIFLIV